MRYMMKSVLKRLNETSIPSTFENSRFDEKLNCRISTNSFFQFSTNFNLKHHPSRTREVNSSYFSGNALSACLGSTLKCTTAE